MIIHQTINKYLTAISAAIVFVSFSLSSPIQADDCQRIGPLTCRTHPSIPSQVTIHERLYTFSDYYEIDSDIGHQGSLIKTKLALQTSYQYYNYAGQHASSAYLRMFSLGSLYTWAGVLDVYDNKGGRIGLIEGAVLTLLPSKFSLYDEKNSLVGTAYMDHDAMGFTICDPVNELKSIANYRRIFVKDVVDHWIITINEPYAIDLRLLYSFGAFVLDNQGDFRIDD